MAARTQAQRREETRQAVLTAAIEVMSERGFHDTSVEAVAQRAGVSTGALYRYFASKSDLFLAVLHEAIPGWVQSYGTAIGRRAASNDDPVNAVAKQWARLTYDVPQGWQLLVDVWSVAVRDPELRPQFARRYAELLDAVEQAMEPVLAQRRTTLDARRTAQLIVALGDGLALQRIADPVVATGDLMEAGMRLLLGDLASG